MASLQLRSASGSAPFDRNLQWSGVAPGGGKSCGTIEGHVLDPGQAEVTRIPRPGVLAVSTCSSVVRID